MLPFADESEALTHPYLARAWAERVNGGAKTGHVAVQNQAMGGARSAMARALPT